MGANERMRELWNGEAGDAWVEHADRHDRMLDALGRHTLDAARIQPGERVLDVGCGTGQLAVQAAGRAGGAGRVVGVDISGPMLEAARRRAAGLPQVQFVQADCQTDPLPGPFDVAVSRFGVMFFDDPVAAFANLLAATRPGGRLAFVAWQSLFENEWALVPAAVLGEHVPLPEPPPPGEPGPFAFADPDRVRSILDGAGWAEVSLEDVRRPVPLAGGRTVDEVLAVLEQDVMVRTLLADADDATRAEALAALRAELADRAGPNGVELGAAAWVVTAVRPEG